jgi:hypothetical protein
MTPKEKVLYHQIHPAKLFTDCASLIALYPLWWHELPVALVIMLVPPPIASWLVIRYANLERQRQSAFGRYVARSMTHAMEAVRLGGMIVIAFGTWNRSAVTIAFGVVVILFGWTRGLLMPTRSVTGKRPRP